MYKKSGILVLCCVVLTVFPAYAKTVKTPYFTLDLPDHFVMIEQTPTSLKAAINSTDKTTSLNSADTLLIMKFNKEKDFTILTKALEYMKSPRKVPYIVKESREFQQISREINFLVYMRSSTLQKKAYIHDYLIYTGDLTIFFSYKEKVNQQKYSFNNHTEEYKSYKFANDLYEQIKSQIFVPVR